MNKYVIAECCQNHNGDIGLLKEMIHAAADAGTKYVKIQAIRSSELTKRDRFEDGLIEDGVTKVIKRPYKEEYERLKALDLSLEQESWFVEECIKAGISPMITVFSKSSLNEIKDLGYEAVKIASYDCASFELLKEVKKHFKRIFISTGATYDDEIQEASKLLSDRDCTFLHCVTIYPTPMEQLHLQRLKFLHSLCASIGYSDHSETAKLGLWPSKIAFALGAECVERHFTILQSDETKDGVVSIGVHDLSELNRFANLDQSQMMEEIEAECPDWKVALGKSKRDLSETELLNRDYYRGRFASKINGKVVYNWE